MCAVVLFGAPFVRRGSFLLPRRSSRLCALNSRQINDLQCEGRIRLRESAGRGTWAQGVAGSNPVAPTTFIRFERGSTYSALLGVPVHAFQPTTEGRLQNEQGAVVTLPTAKDCLLAAQATHPTKFPDAATRSRT